MTDHLKCLVVSVLFHSALDLLIDELCSFATGQLGVWIG